MRTNRPHALLALALTLVGVGALAQSEALQKLDQAWVDEQTSVCINCHGSAAPTTGDDAGLAPKLGGQRPVYFENALRSYRTPARDHFFMRGISRNFSREEVSVLARHFGTAPAKAGAKKAPQAPASVQRCLACHTPASDREGEFPVLDGQHERYIQKALGDYIEGRRTNPAMRAIVVAEDGKPLISEKEIDEAAKWFSSRKGLVVR